MYVYVYDTCKYLKAVKVTFQNIELLNVKIQVDLWFQFQYRFCLVCKCVTQICDKFLLKKSLFQK